MSLIVDLACALVRGITHQHHDGHRRAGTGAEIFFLLPGATVLLVSAGYPRRLNTYK